MSKRIAIIGGGGWGLALAKLLSENRNEVLVWEYHAKYLHLLKTEHRNPDLLKDIVLPAEIAYTGDWQDIIAFHPELVILATPTQFLRFTLRSIPSELWRQLSLRTILNVAKGIEEHSLNTIDQILLQELPANCRRKICALSGPSHAEEVARGIPTTVVIAGADEDLLIELQKLFSNSYFRAYRTLDLTGVEIGGAVKNIIAIAAGIVAGLGFGDNTIGALLTRGIVEISRLGTAMNASSDTFLGLSGIGDLVTTATSHHSRNRHVGYEIGKGRKLQEILSDMPMVAEGVASTRSVYQLAASLKVEMPITEQVYQVLYEDKEPLLAIKELMTRDLKAE